MRRLASPGYLLLVCAAALPLSAAFLPGLSADSVAASLGAGAALGAMHVVLKPVLKLITAPLGCLTLGLASFAIDVGLIYLAGYLLGGFHITAFEGPVFAALIVNFLCALPIGARRA